MKIKAEIGQVLTKEFGATYLCNRSVTQMVGDGGGKAAAGGLLGVVIKEPHFVPPVLELVK